MYKRQVLYHQSSLLARQSTLADVRKRNTGACVLTSSSRRGDARLFCGLHTWHVDVSRFRACLDLRCAYGVSRTKKLLFQAGAFEVRRDFGQNFIVVGCEKSLSSDVLIAPKPLFCFTPLQVVLILLPHTGRPPRAQQYRAKKHVPRVSPYSPASIDPGFVEIGLLKLSQSVKTTKVTHTLTDTD